MQQRTYCAKAGQQCTFLPSTEKEGEKIDYWKKRFWYGSLIS
jgi:hypothetical protein